ncbi:MAG: hypothetical protein CFE21_10245 [Bacteroidetes bacterium B1(2017)]|nr:MAG: hypothetical protein CFE21_10245 [Bacteroidetes bacterium B1(2017)]
MKFLFCLIFLLLGLGSTFAQNPTIKVLDTDFSKGRLNKTTILTLEDVGKFHGHLCDGLALGFMGLREGLSMLYPDSIIDRTNTRIVSKSSPCITDIAIYLTGARYQYNSFYVSDSIPYLFIVQRKDNSKTIGIKLKPGIKPYAIDSLGKLANDGRLSACELNSLKKLEDEFTQYILQTNPKEIFVLVEITDFNWDPKLSNSFIKTDIINKAKSNCEGKNH